MSCRSITDELVRRGYEVFVLTSNWQASGRQVDGNVYRLLHLREPSSRHPLGRRWQHLRWALASRVDCRVARRLMQTLSPDIVYVWNMSHLSLGPVGTAQNLGLPLVFDLGDYWLLERYHALCTEPDPGKRKYRLFVHGLKRFNPLAFRHILTNSETLKQCYVETGFPADHISVIPRGLPARVIRDTPPTAAHHSSVDLLFAGRLTEAKGVHLAIHTVALLNHELGAELGRPVRLTIVGEGDPPYVQRLKKLVGSLGLQQGVHFMGKVTQEELCDLYQRHDAVLIPSIWLEPFGNVAIEAMSQGTCVIASERGGPAEIITHGQNGLLVPPEDPHAMARAVAELDHNEGLRDRIRRAAIATVRERFVLDKVGDKVESYLRAAIAAPSRDPGQ